MAIALNGTTGYLELGAKVVSALPLSMVCYVASNFNGVGQFFISQVQSNADRYMAGWMDSNFSSMYANARTTTQSSSATLGTGGPSSSVLKLCVVVFTSTTSRTIYFDSATPATVDTGTVGDELTNHDRLTIGAFHYNGNSPSLFLSGSIAEAHLYNTALSAGDVTTLLGGAAPEGVSGWVDGWILETASDLTSIGGTRTLTANGGVTTSGLTHPISTVGRGGGGGTSSVMSKLMQLSN
jgi:hypothetical protein